MNAGKGNKVGKGAGHMSCEERLSIPGLSSLEQRRPRGDPRALCNSLRRGSAGEVPASAPGHQCQGSWEWHKAANW